MKPKLRKALRILTGTAGVYLVIAIIIGCSGIADKLILLPPTMDMDPKGATRELLRTAEGKDLELWHARSRGAAGEKPPAAYVLYFVGNADRAERTAVFQASQWGDMAIELVGVNLPGYGGSTGPAKLSAIAPAALAAYDHLRAQSPGTRIFVVATSVGTTAALHLAAHRDVAGVVVQSPPALRQLIMGHHGWWNLWLLSMPVALSVPGELDSIANARNAKAPAVFILTGQDQVVPLAYQRRIMSAYAGPVKTLEVPDAAHNTTFDEAFYAEYAQALAWLWNGQTR